MTTFHKVDLSLLGVCGDTEQERTEQDKILIRGSARAATTQQAAVFIYEKCTFWGEEDDVPIGAIVSADLAKELIREGRLAGPPIASMTVVKGYNA